MQQGYYLKKKKLLNSFHHMVADRSFLLSLQESDVHEAGDWDQDQGTSLTGTERPIPTSKYSVLMNLQGRIKLMR